MNRPIFEKLSFPIVMVFVLGIVANYLLTFIVPAYFSLTEMGNYQVQLHMMGMVENGIRYGINLFLGFWIFSKAVNHKYSWMFFSFVFGINAILLFYIIQLIDKKEKS